MGWRKRGIPLGRCYTRTVADTPSPSPVAVERACGGCTLCCKLLGVAELAKPRGRWCAHCRQGQGCTIYDTRPTACREFRCGWLQSAEVSDAWFPARSRMMLSYERLGLVVYVDEGHAGAWRQAPFY